jgi:hypothetical protein
VSYWDVWRGAQYIAPVEAGLAVAAGAMIWRARPGWAIRFAVFALLLLELWIVRTWLFFFVDS